MAHTPGPWVMGQTPFNYEDALVSADGQVIAYASWGGGSSCNLAFENEADARLIASAPDLFEAVQNLMGLFDTPVVRRRLKDDALYPEVIIQARAAIARAKGE